MVPYPVIIREAASGSRWEQRQKEFKLEVSVKSFPLELKEEAERLKKPEGMENTRRTRPFELTKQGALELTEAEAGNTELTWVSTRFFAYIL